MPPPPARGIFAPMAANPYERIHDLTVNHRVGLSRYSSNVVRRVLAMLKVMDARLVARIAGDDMTGLQRTRAEQLIDALFRMQTEGWSLLRGSVMLEMEALTPVEARFAYQVVALAADAARVNVFTAAPAPAQVVAAVMARPFQGRFLRGWLDEAEAGAKRRVRDSIRQGFVEGQTIPEMVRTIRGTKRANYRDGILEGTRRGTEAMVRTAVTHTATVAHEEVYRANGDVVKGVIWTSTLDSRTTKVCMARSEKVYPIDKGPRPPAHVNCLPGAVQVSTAHRITGAFKRWYEGDLVVIRTAAGQELTCTPNHPVLTNDGWVAAGLLNVGGHVIRDAGIERVALVDDNDQDVETCIEDVAESTFASSRMVAREMPTAPEDFHGDGAGSEVAIVAADRRLSLGHDSTVGEHFGQSGFGRGDMGGASLPGGGRLASMFLRLGDAANSGVGGGGQGLALRRCSAGHAGGLLGGAAPDIDASLGQDANNDVRGHTQGLRNTGCAHALGVLARDLGTVQGQAPAAERVDADPHGDEAPADGLAFDAKLARYLADGLAGPVAVDVIAAVERLGFAGHVFNLETESGWYVAGGIITHNCRSTTRPLINPIPGVLPYKAESYTDWLNRQPAETQDDILGPKRGRLFRAGGLPLDRFVDKTGSEYTLEQLRQRDAAAFARAGL